MSALQLIQAQGIKKLIVLAIIYSLCLPLSVAISPFLTLALIALPLALWAFVKALQQPELVAYALFGSLFIGNLFYLVPSESFPITTFKAALALGIFVFLVRFLSVQQLKFEYTGVEGEILAILALICLSIMWTPAPQDALFSLVRFLTSLFMCFVVYNLLSSRKALRVVFYIIAIAGIVVAILSVRDLLSNPYAAVQAYLSGGTKSGDRATVVDEDPNIVATLFFLPAFFGGALLSQPKANKKWQLFGLVVMGASLAGLGATLSRSGMLSMGIGFLVLMVSFKSTRIFWAGILGSAAAIALRPGLILTLVSLARRFIGLITGQVDASAGLRVKLLEASWEMFVNSHLLGVGFRGFGPTYREMNYVSQMAYVFEPHNMTYTVYAELGLIGLLIVGWLTYRVIKRAHLNIKDSDEQHPVHKALNMAVFCALIAYLVFYQFLGGAFNNNLFLLVCTLPFIIHKVQQKTVTSTT